MAGNIGAGKGLAVGEPDGKSGAQEIRRDEQIIEVRQILFNNIIRNCKGGVG